METTLLEKFTQHLRTQRYATNTINAYISMLKDYPTEQPTQENTDSFLRKHNHQVARAFLKQYLEYTNITHITIKKIKGRKPKKQTTALTKQEIETLALNMPMPKYSLFIIVKFETGLRISEMLSITPLNIDFQNLLIRGKGKGGKQFEQCITQDTADALSLLCEYTQENEPIWKITRQQAGNYIRKTSKKILGKQIHPHIIRHSLNEHLRKQGMPAEYRAIYMNHDTKQLGVTIGTYGHITRQEAHQHWRAIMTPTNQQTTTASQQ